ncbi:site-specific DNA-methyltransferase [TM7 phylum sp. oral taxon 349]|nr:site-specific DNA-methyltransferase [TM7 phylum sp. oral taxon 349]
MNGYNDDITNDQLAKLRQLFPEVFTEDNIDWARLKATLGEAVGLGERYGLGWKGKSDVFAKIQEKTVETLHADRDHSVDWDTTSNMFIEGDNLAALKILHKSYYGKVKMIYIDPPYNTGNDFVYNDDFKQTRKSYEAEVGITDDEGNVTRDDGLCSNTGGHKHSNWLNMMYPRLFLARNLLRQDGVIFVSIDDNEVHNLRLMMNEIFGEENFVAQIVWRRKRGKDNSAKFLSRNHEYLLVFARSIDNLNFHRLALDDTTLKAYKNPDNDPRGAYRLLGVWARGTQGGSKYSFTAKTGQLFSERLWLMNKSSMEKMDEENRLVYSPASDKIYRKLFVNENTGNIPETIWNDTSNAANAADEIKKIFDFQIFDTVKPIPYIERMLQLSTEKSDIVLDFFSGSGTTAHAVMQLNAEDGGNRQWICAQLPEQTSEKSEAFKAGYANIADIARERIRRAGAKIRTDFADKLAERERPLDLGFRSYSVGESNFKPWNEIVTDPEEIRQQMLDIIDPIEPSATDESILTELLLKRGISPMAEVEDRDAYVFVPSASLAIRLAPDLTEAEFSEILASGAQTILLLSRALGTNETLRINLTLQAEQQGVRVEVV